MFCPLLNYLKITYKLFVINVYFSYICVEFERKNKGQVNS